ncbi:hypothetical protein TNCV_1392811 [Trichonephila clavipes]|nr:hypothetical protein TNCV_1392811 [Trichonephila clavipes]
MVERCIRQYSPFPSNLQDLNSCITNSWYSLDVNALMKHEDSMPKRIRVDIRAKAELAERWTELPQVSDESRSFFRVHTGYFSNIPKCIKAEFIASIGDVLSPVLYRAPSVRINLTVCLIELCTSFELRDKFGGSAGYNYVKRG